MKQYGIRLRQDDDMSWNEFCNLLSGLMPDTPLGKIVAIRAEKDPKAIKEFNETQRKIRNDWIISRNKRLRKDPEAYRMYLEQFQKWARDNFS